MTEDGEKRSPVSGPRSSVVGLRWLEEQGLLALFLCPFALEGGVQAQADQCPQPVHQDVIELEAPARDKVLMDFIADSVEECDGKGNLENLSVEIALMG